MKVANYSRYTHLSGLAEEVSQGNISSPLRCGLSQTGVDLYKSVANTKVCIGY